MRGTGIIVLAAVVIALVGSPAVAEPGRTRAASAVVVGETAPKGDQEFRAAWATLAALSQGAMRQSGPDVRQQARLSAVLHMEAAVAADPRNAVYKASLAYLYLLAGKYDKARESASRAVDLSREDPLFHLWRGQAEAALAQMDPASAGQHIGPALAAFDRAAELDRDNALPLLQGASVAFDVSRPDLALPRVKQALSRDNYTLYSLPIPFDLFSDRAAAVDAWQYLQTGLWMELLARCWNVAAAWTRLGQAEEEAGRLDVAEERFRDVMQMAGLIGRATPHLFLTVATAIDIMEDAYSGLARISEAKESREAERWRGELGVIEIGRAMLAGALQPYLDKIREHPPSSPEELLSTESDAVATIVAGIGLERLRPGDERPPGDATE